MMSGGSNQFLTSEFPLQKNISVSTSICIISPPTQLVRQSRIGMTTVMLCRGGGDKDTLRVPDEEECEIFSGGRAATVQFACSSPANCTDYGAGCEMIVVGRCKWCQWWTSQDECPAAETRTPVRASRNAK
ncbi:hypothetical protein J6590_102474 [Homalodisca vitripennis]|nr:hypothetical protein J6590_034920 [Homalodisca vitripennis]KAG8308741.1 hypothetical protein J6590_102474 [Homalodisca vitripennis]